MTAVVVVVLVLGAIAAGIGIAGLSVNETIGSPRAAATVSARLASDPAVQARVRDGVVDALVAKVPILGGFRSMLQGIVGTMAREPRFQRVLNLAIRRSILQLLDGRSSQVTLGIDDVRGPLVDALGGSVVTGLLPPPGSTDRFVVVDAASVKQLRQARSVGVRAAGALLVIGAVLLVAGVVLARGWRSVAVGIGAASLAVVAVLVAPAATPITGRTTDSIADPIGRAAARAVWDVAIHDLSARMWTVAAFAATVAMIAFAAAVFRRARARRREAVAGVRATGSPGHALS